MNSPSASTQIALIAQAPDEANTRLHGRGLLLARIVWVAIVVLALGLFIASIPTSYATVLPTLPHSYLGLPAAFFDTYSEVLNVVFACCYIAVAGILFWRKSDDRMALFASFTLVTFVIAFSPSLGALPQAWQVPVQLVSFFGSACLGPLFYLFPTGQFVPRWTRWFSLGVIVYWAEGSLFPGPSANPLAHIPLFSTVTAIGFIGSIVVAQIHRYRRVSSPLQRQQTKWVVFGTSSALLGYIGVELLNRFVSLYVPRGLLSYLIASTVSDCFMLLIPLSLGFAILRYRLWDIDLIVNRTLVYGLLSGCVVGIYVLVVGSLGALLQASGNLLISLAATGLVAVLFQPLRARLQRTVNRLMYGSRDEPYRIISLLGERLEATLTPDTILPTVAETVAHAFKLPYVAIELKAEEDFRQVAAYGTPIEPALRIPLRYQQEVIGQFLLASRSPGESFSSADRRLLNDLARQAGIAANAIRLSADLQHSRERLLLAREEERRRLARELHDSVSQALYGISLGVHTARKALERDPQQVVEPLNYVLSLTESALAEMRALIFELRPESLEVEGLVAALTKQAAAIQARQGIAVMLDLCDEPGLPLQVKQDLYRIAQEAMHNVVKHARASTINVRLSRTHDAIILEVRDDGVGFGTATSYPGHLGLHSMHERVANLGGTFQIESTPGAGTRVCVRIPSLA